MKVSINDYMNNFDAQKDDSYGFFDWFCKDSSLKKRAESLLVKIKFLVENKIINPDTTYVWLKNNCPSSGTLYDDMRFSLLNDEETYIGGIAPSLGYNNSNKGKCDVWMFNDNGDISTLQFENWVQFKKEVRKDNELRTLLQNNFYRSI